jgi:tetratricopeptide (TPR) repeat protein
MSEKPEPTELERENRRNLRRLVLSIQASLGKLSLFVGICDNSQYRDAIVQTYERELQAQGVACQRVTIDRNFPSLKQTLLDRQERESPLPSDPPIIVTVLGVDTLLSVRLGEPKSPQEKFFFSAQWTRESLRQFQFPVVIWVTEKIARSLAQQAPDFWSWRGGVFEFHQPIGYTVEPFPVSSSESSQEYTHEPIADPAEIRQQIEALLAEDPNSPLLRSLYSSLGQAYDERLEQGKATNYPQEQQHAISAFQKAIDLAAEDDSPLATDCNYLALLYKSMGRYSEAEPLLVRSLSIREQQLGADHPDTATSLNNLAQLYTSMGRYSEAEPLYVRSLSIREQQLGADHPDTATSLNDLAALYTSMGRYSEAEPLYVRSLSIREQQLGADHPDTATSLNDLAALYTSMGRYSEAEPLYVRSLSIVEQQLGADHPSTAQSLNNLAELYRSMGRYSEAEPLYVRSLSICEQQLGADHPSTAQSLNNLALLYTSMGRYSEAEPLLVRSLSISEQQLGADHPDTVTSLHNLALLYTSMGRYSEAEPLISKALAIAEQQLGIAHPTTMQFRQNLATLLWTMSNRTTTTEDPIFRFNL